MSAPIPTVPLPPLSRWPAVSVVVPARDSAATLESAVRSALDQRFDGSIEVVLAVAPSSDGTERIAGQLSHEHPKVRYQPNLRKTTSAGLNAALRVARGDVIVRLDAHAQLPEGYIARALDILRETGAANVGGMQVPAGEGGRFERAVAVAMRSPLGAGAARYRLGGPPGEVPTVYLGVFRREALAEVGGFDEELLRNQDFELNHRLRAAGHKVYFHPDLRVRYRPRSSMGDLFRQYFDYGSWKLRVLGRHPRSLRPRQIAPPALLLVLLASAVWSLAARSPAAFTAIAGLYLLALAGGVVLGVARDRDGAGPADIPATVVALATMHLAWGLGFLLAAIGLRRGRAFDGARSRKDAEG